MKSWKAQVAIPDVPADFAVRQAAIERSAATLREAQAKQPHVDRVTDSIRDHVVVRNHLAERLMEAYGRR